MRSIFATFACLLLAACGTETSASGGTDAATDTAAEDSAVADTASGGDTASSTDTASGTDTTTAADTPGSDSGWYGKVFVNEVHAGGSKTPTVATDADWFELYNKSDKEMDLTGCKVGGLTNGLSGANPVPAGAKVPAGGFLVIYYNHNNLGTPVIDAGIKSDGSMALWDKDGLMVDSVDWNEGDSPAGSSYDRTPDGSPTWKTVTPPTPGQPNSK